MTDPIGHNALGEPIYPPVPTIRGGIGQFVVGVTPVGTPVFNPPSAGLPRTIPAYLYWEYSDDDDLRAFVMAYNRCTQYYVDWFNAIGLPIYTGEQISGPLLDWVGAGLYGLPRPTLPSGRNQDVGPFNTWALNTIAFNTLKKVGPVNYAATSDDVYKRILTWHFFKGDGKRFDIRWLKRRVMRFLTGANGAAGQTDQTYQVSVTFGPNRQANIRLLSYLRRVVSGPLNTWAMNTTPLNTLRSSITEFAPLAFSQTFKTAVDAGVLELPFQFTWVVTLE